MERGEIAIVSGQFIALVVVILLLSNLVPGISAATTGIGKVYWGTPSGGVTLSKGGTNIEQTNASTISVLYTLSPGTNPASVSAVRLCLDPTQNNTGGTQVYTDIDLNYSSSRHTNYISFGPTEQEAGQVCTYTVSLTDSSQTTVTWTASVKVNSTAT